ncbi:MAG: DoxX family protein [Rhodobacteraceae bacterium]|nr:DoxX family protein [Paracoccaceae bacterium]
MNTLISLHNAVFHQLEKLAPFILPHFARFVFAAVLLVYYWNSGLTKLGDGIFGFINLDFGAYFQMFPKAVEAAGYDASQLPFIYKIIAVFGTWAEFILPLLIVLGLFTRLAALGMIGFIFVQSYVDITGHGADEATIGAWFDNLSDGTILDQRAFWVFTLTYLVFKGAGALSLDAILSRVGPWAQPQDETQAA